VIVYLNKPMHVYEVRPRKDHRGVDLISDALLFGRLWLRRTRMQSATVLGTPHTSGLLPDDYLDSTIFSFPFSLTICHPPAAGSVSEETIR
jgi:hypothetical protein